MNVLQKEINRLSKTTVSEIKSATQFGAQEMKLHTKLQGFIGWGGGGGEGRGTMHKRKCHAIVNMESSSDNMALIRARYSCITLNQYQWPTTQLNIGDTQD